jgi:hypothetical protein
MKVKLTATLMTLAAMLTLPVAAMANAPSINITSPTSGTTIFVPSFPANVPISFEVTHDFLQDVNVLNVLVNAASIFNNGGVDLGSPFDKDNLCTPSQMILPNISACSTNSSNIAYVTAPWSVTGPGTYAVSVYARHKNEVGTDTEDADVQMTLINIEYPAPPAVANAYIKANYSKLSSGVRGCIISKIADNHAKLSAYGPKGGPYNTGAIQADVEGYKSTCQ